MFCTSLRKRRQWETVPKTLLESQVPKWQEKHLQTHDLAIPLPPLNPQQPHEYFRLLLLSPTDLQPLIDTMARIERLYHQNGGQYVGIVFLLNEENRSTNGSLQMMHLQASLLPALEMPILPLHTLPKLQATLFSFQRKFVTTRSTASAPISQLYPEVQLLPYCTTKAPLPEHTRNILSDSYHSISDLAQAATTEDGKQGLRHWIYEPRMGSAEDVIDFWKEEYMVE